MVQRTSTVKPGELEVGTRIYYTGDMANVPWWGTVVSLGELAVIVQTDDNRDKPVPYSAIGNIYRGHASPRFVTKAAYDAYREEQFAGWEKATGKPIIR